MTLCTIRPQEQRKPINLSWIVDELIGIRTLERRLCDELGSPRRPNPSYLLDRIQLLSCRVDKLDRVLDEYEPPKPRRSVTNIAFHRANA